MAMDIIFGRNKKEQPEPVRAQVTGRIPSWLQGTLLRNGPGMHTVGETRYNHWFDGLALLHSFTIRDGEVYYRSKYLRSDTYNANTKANRIVVSEFGTMAHPDPCKNIFSKAFSYWTHIIPDFTDNCLINIMRCGEDFYATTETNYIRKINPQTLETLEKVDYRNYVAVNLATSHPHYDAAGNVLNMGTSIMGKGKTKYVILKIPAAVPGDGKGKDPLKHMKVLGSVPSRSRLTPSYYHSFGVTETYIVFLEQPFKLDILKMSTAYIRGVNWASCLTFHREDQTYIHIIDQRTGKPLPTKFYTDPMVVFHHVNAYEEGGCLLFDVIAYEDSSLYELFYLANLNQDFEENSRSTSIPTLRRFAVPLQVDKSGLHSRLGCGLDSAGGSETTPGPGPSPDQCGHNLWMEGRGTRAWSRPPEASSSQSERTDHSLANSRSPYRGAPSRGDGGFTAVSLSAGLELPRINYAHNGKPYRYVFAAEVQWSPFPTKILKYDVLTKSSLKWGQEHCWPAEPLFVPTPGAKDEDDGIILSAIVSTDPQKLPFLLVLDAKSFTELACASIDVDMHLDLHGLFIPDTEGDSREQAPSQEQQDRAPDCHTAPRT
ncbi:beta,beta-carotene 15,15'-dioxygenase [Suricata suricatta]|uniref:beta,beta-carotene 15,15'-dioxygenase n=1 Tax=Suricata suricatta TaxID=37032 RepID=UPI0011556CB2|nr:beta,beta-carotene 15,15'-dioxygenase [Suricata suricatta]